MKSFIVLLCLCFLSVGPLSAGVLFTTGPLNGTSGATQISLGNSVTDSFNLLTPSTISTFEFATWNFAGAVVTNVDWAIGTAEFGSDFSGTAAVSSSYVFTNALGSDIYMNTVSGLNVSLAAGSYWLTLSNAVSNPANPVGWDSNNGSNSTAVGSDPLGPVNTNTFSLANPEPGTMVLFAGGMLALAGTLRRRKAR